MKSDAMLLKKVKEAEKRQTGKSVNGLGREQGSEREVKLSGIGWGT